MKLGISNRINTIPVIINVIWALFILYQFLFRVPNHDNQDFEHDGGFVFAAIILTALISVGSLIYILIANAYMKVKIYYDLYFPFIPALILIAFILFR